MIIDASLHCSLFLDSTAENTRIEKICHQVTPSLVPATWIARYTTQQILRYINVFQIYAFNSMCLRSDV